MQYNEVIELIGRSLEIVGVAIIVLGAIASSVVFLQKWFKKGSVLSLYKLYRQNLGRSILLGLEFLVAGDIITSIAIPPTLTSVTVLAIIILIRSFLAIELEMEIEGKWPWQKRSAQS